MKQNRTIQLIVTCLLALVSQMVMAIASIKIDTTPLPNIVVEPTAKSSEEELLIHVTEVMPRFPGCEDIEGTDHDKKQCADQKLLHYIYSSLRYPKDAKEKGIEGIAIVSFVVDKQGKIKNVQVIRTPGNAIGQEAIRIVTTMNKLPEPWTPGRQMGKVVEVRLNLPIRFRLR